MNVIPSIAVLLTLLTTSCLGNVLMCYFGSWAVYRPGNGRFNPGDIDPKLCTHMIYTFIGVNSKGSVVSLDAWADLPDGYGKDGFAKFIALKQISPSTKALVGIGGWNQGSRIFSAVVSNPVLRATFVKNALAFVQKYNFDGLDVDWEYPAQRGGAKTDVKNYVLLLKELREAFEPAGLLLMAAVAGSAKSAGLSYDIPSVSKYLDYINVMAYDLHGSWDKVIGINAPLYPASHETTAEELELNVDACITYWLENGADPSKLVLGVPLYGRTFTLTDPSQNKPGSPAKGPGTAGPYTREAGFMGYNELCEKKLTEDWTNIWSDEQQTPYAYRGNQWIGYEDARSVAVKANYALSKKLAGIMFWSVETDDFKSICGNGTYPLIRTTHDILFASSGPELASTTGGSVVIENDITETSSTTSQGENQEQSTCTSRSTTARTTNGDKPVTPQYTTSTTVCTGNGYIRHKDDCSKFWQCVKLGSCNYLGYLLTCPGGLVFDINHNYCNWPNDVTC